MTGVNRGPSATLFLAFVIALLILPVDAKAEIVGTASPSGGFTLVGSDNTSTSKVGVPAQFDSTIQFDGLTATGIAQNAYAFTNVYVAAGADAKLSVSGSIPAGSSSADARLLVGATISGQMLGPAPPEGADYYYWIVPTLVTMSGQLAPGDEVYFLVSAFATEGNGNSVYAETYTQSFTNTGTDMMSLGGVDQFPAAYLGDWYGVSEFGGFPGSLTFEIQEVIYKTNTSSSDKSWIDIDPTFGFTGSTSPSLVPEPSGLLLSSLAILCGAAFAVCRRIQFRSGSRFVAHRDVNMPQTKIKYET
jgi:hypothetical protein